MITLRSKGHYLDEDYYWLENVLCSILDKCHKNKCAGCYHKKACYDMHKLLERVQEDIYNI